MTSSSKSFLRFGPLAAVMVISAALAAMGSFRPFPALAGPVKKVCTAGAAITMAIQGAVMCPKGWPSRFIVKPHVMGTGSLMLLAGAALLVVLLFAGCTPPGGTLGAHFRTNFTAAKRQELEPRSALDGSNSLAARLLPGKRTRQNRPLARGCDLRACGSASQSMRAQNRASACAPGGQTLTLGR
jgi:hypothetical protein